MLDTQSAFTIVVSMYHPIMLGRDREEVAFLTDNISLDALDH